MKLYLLMFGLGLSQIIPFDQTLPILTGPVVQVKTGWELRYRLSNFKNASCVATLSFYDPKFLPISAVAKPKNCAGDSSAKISIPLSVPNGTAAVQWQCSGAQGISVDLMVISGGMGDYEAFLNDSEQATIIVECRNGTGSAAATCRSL
ncbi:uncharacterized protein K441DRAFT_630441, partial [Cenococcum geophilum 1.58]|uniref:uncharacterized protein n=1 Tax=Cenococcum geophilum 1.58 TaxID=794803 RepID=UPI00358FF22E